MKRFIKFVTSSILIGTLLFGSVAQAAPVEPKIYLNGQEYQVRQGESMVLYQEEVLLPASIVNENSTIQWDKASNTVYIENKNIPAAPVNTIQQNQTQVQAAPMSEEAYKAKLKELVDNMEKLYNKYPELSIDINEEDIDDEDMDRIIMLTDKFLYEMRPIYLEFIQLNAPEAYVQEQEKIKIGAEVSIKLLDYTKELSEMFNSNISDYEAIQRLDAMEKDMNDSEGKLDDFQNAVETVLGEDYSN